MMTAVPIKYVQVGWQKCIACSDQKILPGRMWLGVTKGGHDINVTCPECNGTTQVPRYCVIDLTTGQEIDYEAFGRDVLGNPLHYVPQEVSPHVA